MLFYYSRRVRIYPRRTRETSESLLKHYTLSRRVNLVTASQVWWNRCLGMDEILQKLADSMLSGGPMGGIVMGLAYGYWKLQQKLSAVQEQRVADAMKLADATNTMANALDRNTDTLKSFVLEE